MTHGAAPGIVAADPVGLLRLRGACDEAATALGGCAADLAAAAPYAPEVGDWSWRLRTAAAWAADEGRDLTRRALALDTAADVPSGGAPGAWDRFAEGLVRGATAGVGALDVGGGLGDLRDVRRSDAWVERARRQQRAFRGVLDDVGAGGVAARLAKAEGQLEVFGRISEVTDDVVPWLRTADGVLGAWGVAGDVATLIEPPHQGWYGFADRVVASAGLAAGIAELGALTGLVALTPAGAAAVGVVAVGAGLYAVGSYAYDHRQRIGAAVGQARDVVVDAVSDGADLVSTAYDWGAERLGRALGGVGATADRAGGWVGRALGVGT